METASLSCIHEVHRSQVVANAAVVLQPSVRFATIV